MHAASQSAIRQFLANYLLKSNDFLISKSMQTSSLA